MATQEPFSAIAAQRLSTTDFLTLTQVSLVASIPLLLARSKARLDFWSILRTRASWPRLAILFGVGVAGLALYDVALSSAHPIISAAELNLSPFWAALVARIVSGKRLPQPRSAFLACFAVAFIGAMLVAISQLPGDVAAVFAELLHNLAHSRWALAIPMPVFFALNGSLVYKWFGDFDECAAIAANFAVSAAVLIPTGLWLSSGAHTLAPAAFPAVALLLLGTLVASAAGRVFYQAALGATNNDNGFVTMFFLAIPAVSTLISLMLSPWAPALSVSASPLFCAGLALVTLPLAVYLLVSLRSRA